MAEEGPKRPFWKPIERAGHSGCTLVVDNLKRVAHVRREIEKHGQIQSRQLNGVEGDYLVVGFRGSVSHGAGEKRPTAGGLEVLHPKLAGMRARRQRPAIERQVGDEIRI